MKVNSMTGTPGSSEKGSRAGEVVVRYVGGPTAIIEIGGARLITDPTFDPPGDHPIGSRVLTKTAGPAMEPDLVGSIDAVLLSHDQHPDNLDTAGRAFLATAPLILSTADAHERLGNRVQPLPNWEHVDLPLPDEHLLQITGVPALHGPDGSRHLVGEVTGFVLSAAGLPTVYISGDNASLEVVQAIADRTGPIDLALLFAGAAQTPLIEGAHLTLTSEQAAQATVILDATHVIPLHFEDWTHFTQGGDTLLNAFDRAGISERLHILKRGTQIRL
jgi:L-ascorbate metabolism protein UlaG (beta-lactamase superfamily)